MEPKDSEPPFTKQVNVKMTPALLEGLKRIHEKHKLAPAEMLRSLGVLAVESFDQYGHFQFPCQIIPLLPNRSRKKNKHESAEKEDRQKMKRQAAIMLKRYPEDFRRIMEAMAREADAQSKKSA